MATTENGTSELRIARKHPGIAWQGVCTNVHTTGLSDHIKSTWYAAIRNNTEEQTLRCNSSHNYNVLRAMRGNTTASTNCLRRRTIDIDLDKNQDSGNTTHTPQTHTRGVNPTTDFPSLAPRKAGDDNMDRDPSSSIPSPETATSLLPATWTSCNEPAGKRTTEHPRHAR